jgi:hypothetical protein
MPTYTCPNQGAPMKLSDVLSLINTDSVFANFFATTVQAANKGSQDAINCIDSYLQPTVDELLKLGIPRSQIGPMRKCTESGNLVLAKCFEKAPEAFGGETLT